MGIKELVNCVLNELNEIKLITDRYCTNVTINSDNYKASFRLLYLKNAYVKGNVLYLTLDYSTLQLQLVDSMSISYHTVDIDFNSDNKRKGFRKR